VNRNRRPIRLPGWLKPLRSAITRAMKLARHRRFNDTKAAR
jgi:hypothetical protein